MGTHERRAYLEAIRGRYRKANQAGKARISWLLEPIAGISRWQKLRQTTTGNASQTAVTA